MSSGQGEIPDWRYSPRACHKTNSRNIMKPDLYYSRRLIAADLVRFQNQQYSLDERRYMMHSYAPEVYSLCGMFFQVFFIF